MEESTPREKILKKIRKALLNKAPRESIVSLDFETPVFPLAEDPLEICFAQNFSEAGGKFFFCADNKELIENIDFLLKENKWGTAICEEEILQGLMEIAEINFVPIFEKDKPAITTCEALIARTGSVMVSLSQGSSTQAFFQSTALIIVAFTSQLVYEMKDAFHQLKQKYDGVLPSSFHIISNPSGLDYQGNEGAIQNPRDLYVFLMDDLTEVEQN
jgi:L-lactate dehydrogenase complex protein LldG